MSAKITGLEKRAGELAGQLHDFLLYVPNVPHATVPVGASDADNQVVRTWGDPRTPPFEAKAHWDVGEALGILDTDAGAKISGARFALYRRAGVKLELGLARFMLDAVGLSDDVSYRFSKWDPNDKGKYIGEAEDWDKSQALMKSILDHLRIDYKEADGEAAFYGPKLDIQIRNVHGKEDTLITVQIDFQLAQRFGMEYVDRDGTKKFPFVIHRTSIGCYERTLALLIEKFAGAFPAWLAPVQVKLLTIADRHVDYADKVFARLRAAGYRVEVDAREEKIGKKIREAQMEKIPYMLVMGDKEEETATVAVRSRREGDLGPLTLDDFMDKLCSEVESRIQP